MSRATVAFEARLASWLESGATNAGIVQLAPEWTSQANLAASMRFQAALVDAVARAPHLAATQIVPYEPFLDGDDSDAQRFYNWLGTVTLLANSVDTGGRLRIRRMIAREVHVEDCFEFANDPTSLTAHQLVASSAVTTAIEHLSFEGHEFSDPFLALNRGT